MQQLADSRTEYESRKAEAEQKLADGLAQLNDAEEQVSQIKKAASGMCWTGLHHELRHL